MEESILKIFARSILRYYATTTKFPAVLGTPYLGSGEEQLALDFSAVIGVSGNYRGNVFYTAPRAKLNALLEIMREDEISDAHCGELVGEITNTISGNARHELGSSFMISSPFLLRGNNEDVRPARGAPCYILPIDWNGFSSRLLISLTKIESEKPKKP